MRVFDVLIRALARFNAVVLAICRYATMGLVAAITVIVIASVIWRYGLNDALSWAESIAKYAMLWMVFTGAPIALARGGHVAIELLPYALPPRLRELMLSVVYLAILLVAGFLIERGVFFAWNARNQVMITAGGYSMLWVFVAVPIGSLFMGTISLEQLLRRLAFVMAPARFPEPQPPLADVTSAT